MASAETITSILTAALGTGFTGAIVWWINRKQEKRTASHGEYDADIRARKDVYDAFGGIIEKLEKSNAQLWESLVAQRERGNKQDIALLECERNSERLENLVQHLRGRVSILEQRETDRGSTRLDSDYDYKNLHGLTPRDEDKDG